MPRWTLADLFLYGEMFMFDIRFNQVSTINMVMATGLAVGESVHLHGVACLAANRRVHSAPLACCMPSALMQPSAGATAFDRRLAWLDE